MKSNDSLAATGHPASRPFARWRLAMQRAMGLRTICTHTFYAPLVGPGSTVLDLGAHTGEFSGAVVPLGCRAVAVEPDPGLFARIPDDPSIQKLRAAIGPTGGRAKLHRPGDATSGSVVASTPGAPHVEVDLVTLDSILVHLGPGRVDLMKVDIEGSETAVLCQLPDAALGRISQITVEFHPHITGESAVADAIRRLRAVGFICLDLNGPPHHSDCLFINWRRLLAARHVVPLAFLVALRLYLSWRRRR